MKRIALGNGYVLDLETHCITLKNNIQTGINEDGKEFETCNIIGHFGNFKNAMQRALNERVKEKLKNNNTIEEFIDIYKTVNKEMERLFKHFKM